MQYLKFHLIYDKNTLFLTFIAQKYILMMQSLIKIAKNIFLISYNLPDEQRAPTVKVHLNHLNQLPCSTNPSINNLVEYTIIYLVLKLQSEIKKQKLNYTLVKILKQKNCKNFKTQTIILHYKNNKLYNIGQQFKENFKIPPKL